MNFLSQHEIAIIAVAVYILSAMVSALPDPPAKFEFYPWFVHVTRSLLNAVPPQYKKAIQAPEEKKV